MNERNAMHESAAPKEGPEPRRAWSEYLAWALIAVVEGAGIVAFVLWKVLQ